MRNRRLALASLVLVLSAALFAAPTAAAAPGAVSASVPASKASDTALGKRLVNSFFAALQAKDTAALNALLSPAFQVARADGSTSTKAQYLKDLPKVEQYALDDFLVTRAGSELVVRYSATTSETINGQVLSKDPALRLSVFVKNTKSGAWRLVAHANFNSPVKQS